MIYLWLFTSRKIALRDEATGGVQYISLALGVPKVFRCHERGISNCSPDGVKSICMRRICLWQRCCVLFTERLPDARAGKGVSSGR